MIAALDPLVRWCIRQRGMVLALTAAFAVLGGVAFRRLVFDAFPDLTNGQVQVLTTAPGLGAEEVERLVTQPLERALAGAPGLTQLRSLSRPGVSAVSVVFTDDPDPWRARQITGELVAAARAEIPPDAGVPTLGPPTTGLGEIYQFTLRSDDRTAIWSMRKAFEVDPRGAAIPSNGVVDRRVERVAHRYEDYIERRERRGRRPDADDLFMAAATRYLLGDLKSARIAIEQIYSSGCEESTRNLRDLICREDAGRPSQEQAEPRHD